VRSRCSIQVRSIADTTASTTSKSANHTTCSTNPATAPPTQTSAPNTPSHARKVNALSAVDAPPNPAVGS
jgi:hypothetical protein